MKNLALIVAITVSLASDHAYAQSQEPVVVKQERLSVDSVLYGKVHESKEEKEARKAQKKKDDEDRKILEKAIKTNPFATKKASGGFKRLPPNTSSY